VECWSFKVYGIVQGVCYRSAIFETIKTVAPRLCGYVKNLDDGTVEVVGIGSEADLKKLHACCYTGSPVSKVSKIEISKLEHIPTGFDSFYIEKE
jgi:acylphosphatase